VGLLTREQVLHLVRARLERAASRGPFEPVGQAASAR
jgi:hypothetical protein